jgi:hypothetical protein
MADADSGSDNVANLGGMGIIRTRMISGFAMPKDKD